jgi:sialate O-acetylesterase
MNRILYLILALALLPFSWIQAEVKVAGIFADNMVLQRDEPVKIWGWADKNENIEISFNGQIVKTKAKKAGTWEITLSPMTFGGPYAMEIKGKTNRIRLDNLLIGDVWLCSGQSNMEWTVEQSANAEKEIAAANYPEIRSFRVPKGIKNEPIANFNGKWEVCSPAVAGKFSGVAYFYARELYRELKIPIGIINASWGGTDIETWISKEVFSPLPPHLKKAYFPEVMENIDQYINENKGSREAFVQAMANDPALTEEWFNPALDVSSWSPIPVPQEWSGTPLALIDGHVWFKQDIDIPEELAGLSATLSLGAIDDTDIAWINGEKLGTNTGWDTPRIYPIRKGILKAGKNNITVRITDNGSSGGMWSPAEDIYLAIHGETGDKLLSLAGEWKYKESVTNTKYKVLEISPNMVYSSLYNTMIHPMTQFRIKGVIWYQGESNAGRAHAYRTLFPAMINDWRTRWGYEFPFYWVQLANLYPLNETPVESDWAELREAQTMTLSLPQTGQAVIYDIGDPLSIHPLNKQEVGRRLALIALNKDYAKKAIIYANPTFVSAEKENNKMIITLDTQGSSLSVHNKYGYVEGFTIAGADKKFVWAKARIEGNKVIVSSDLVDNPVAVRYGWANNPGGNLFNEEGLPVTPFRTDNWKGITQK